MLKKPIKVVGWYHSHPKITVFPSTVDVNTQYSQQRAGDFIGLIFSVFQFDQKSQVRNNLFYRLQNLNILGLKAMKMKIKK